jgi:4-amino-4-deoxy-L-arabinose transferase-like glycosyltransferase
VKDGLIAAALAFAAARTPLRDGARLAPWDPDSFDYAIRMLMRRGLSFEDARANAREFFATTTVGKDPQYAPLFALDEPEWWRLFAPRWIYPALAAALYPRRGFEALVIVPRAAYVLNAPLLYRYLRRFASPPAAALATLWYLRSPQVRHVASFAMTDAPALLFWTATLGAATRVAREGRGWAALSVAIGLLSFTRPLPYLPLGAGAALLLSGALRRDVRTLRRGGGVTALAALATGSVVAVLARAGMPETAAHLNRVRAAQADDDSPWSRKLRDAARRFGLADEPRHPLWRWYASAVALTSATSAYHAARAVVPPLAALALARGSRRPEAALALGAIAGTAGGILGDPVPLGSSRTVVLPLYPVFAAGLALALDGLIAFALARRR